MTLLRVGTTRYITAPLMGLMFFFSLAAASKAPDPVQQIKDYLNDQTEAVHQADTAGEKRALLNETLNTFIHASDRALEDESAADEVVASVEYIKAHFEEKKAELNGTGSYTAIPDQQLDTFATFVQQDSEQAMFDTFGVGGTILIIIAAAALIYGMIVLSEAESGTYY